MKTFARLAVTTNELTKYVLRSAVFWLILGILLVQNTATSGAGTNQSSDGQARAVRRSLQLTTSVVAQEYCRNAAQRSQMDLTLQMTLKNTGDKTLIVGRYANAINRVVLSNTRTNGKSGKYVYDEISTLMRLPWLEQNDIQQVSPTVEFVTLKPGESFDYQYPQNIDITLTDSSDPSQTVSPGKYLMKVKIQTWQWDTEKIKSLEQRWAQIGMLYYWDLTSEPLTISIEKPSPTVSACKVP